MLNVQNIVISAGRPHVELVASGAVEGEPLRPEDFTDDDLREWARANRAANTSDEHLSLDALQHWAGYTFDSYTADYRELRRRLAEVIQ